MGLLTNKRNPMQTIHPPARAVLALLPLGRGAGPAPGQETVPARDTDAAGDAQ